MSAPLNVKSVGPEFAGFPDIDDMGPDFSQTTNEIPIEPPKASVKNPPRRSPLGKLGDNKKLRSPVRKLSDEDTSRLATWYRSIGVALTAFRIESLANLGEAMQVQADACAQAWTDLAANNDKVRRIILGLVEGGDWGRLAASHSPLLLAVLPEDLVRRLVLGVMGRFTQPDEHAQSSED